MWIMMNDSFLSIVEPVPASHRLLVRARKREDIARVFPAAKVNKTLMRDYQFRALIDRVEVADAIAREVRLIGYQNFKDSVANESRHDAYFEVWRAMHQWGNDQ
jgi:hypothetical protein